MGRNAAGAVLMAVFFICAARPAHAFTGSGAGTSGSPYIVTTCTQLAEMENARSSYYTLGNNIDCSAHGAWTPVGQGGNFSGTLDGAGYTVSNLTITRTATHTGLFRGTTGATIKNINVVNAAISSTQYFVGGITGFDNGSTFTKVSVSSSTISSTYSGAVYMGGIIGAWWGVNSTTTISDSYVASTTISDANGGRIGGLIGDIDSGGSGTMTTIINRSYFSGTITGSNTVGGLVGFYYNGGTQELLYINDSFATATTTPSGASAGGIIGYLYNANYYTLTNTYYDAKGSSTLKCGYSGYTISGCTAVNTDNSAPNYFKNSSSVAPMSAWDFSSVWITTANYPALIGADTVVVADSSAVGYYDAYLLRKIASLKVGVSIEVNPSSTVAVVPREVTVRAKVTGWNLGWRALTLHLEYGRCDGKYAPVTKKSGDIRFMDSVENPIFFTNEQSSMAEGAEISWTFPIVMAPQAEGEYCLRTTSDNGGYVDTGAVAKMEAVAVPVTAVSEEPKDAVLASATDDAPAADLCTPSRVMLVPPERFIRKPLKFGDKGSDVLALQQFLNQNGLFLESSGPGALGTETYYFRTRTQAALDLFQETYGFAEEKGGLGPRTRHYINSLFGNPPAVRCPKLARADQSLDRNLEFRSTGSDVGIVQRFLNKNGFLVSEEGYGSPEKETSYFGLLTRAAVGRFQIAFGLLSEMSRIGPLTRRFINGL